MTKETMKSSSLSRGIKLKSEIREVLDVFVLNFVSCFFEFHSNCSFFSQGHLYLQSFDNVCIVSFIKCLKFLARP